MYLMDRLLSWSGRSNQSNTDAFSVLLLLSSIAGFTDSTQVKGALSVPVKELFGRLRYLNWLLKA